jgi:AraC-like DNA-binding protein
MNKSEVLEKGTISIHFVREALLIPKQRGMDTDALLIQAGINPSLLDASAARISPRNFGLMWLLLAETMDDEFFGMDARPMKVGSFTLLCHAIIHSSTLEVALHRALRFFRVIMEDMNGVLCLDNGIAGIRLEETKEARRMFSYATYFVILHGLFCWLVGRRIPILHANFRCDEPEYAEDCRVLFCANARYNTDITSLSFDADFLALPVIQNERSMKDFLHGAPANFLVKYRNSDNQTAKIRRYLRDIPPEQWPNFEALAAHFLSTESTLRRRLDKEGQSYQLIKDDLRRDLSIIYLSRPDAKVAEVALWLGFSEPSAFHRAFKNWTGVNPGKYHQSCLHAV